MANQWIKSKFPGIRYYEHEKRKLKGGIQKDKYYSIMYRLNGKRKDEAIGWASKGWTLQKANEILCTLKENIRLGKHPQTLAEMREMNSQENEKQKQEEATAQAKCVLFKDVFNKYIEQVKIDTTPKTYQNRCDRYRIYIEPFTKNKTLAEIKKQDIEDIKSNMLSKKKADDTIKKTIAIVTQVYKFAIENELYSGLIPSTNVKVQCKDNKRTRYFTAEEAKKLLDEIRLHSAQVHDIVCVALYSGLRAGEIRKLKWEYVLWDSNRILAKWRKNGENNLIPLHPKLKKVLSNRFKDKMNEYIFTDKNGQPLKSISSTYRKCVKKLDLNKGVTDDLNKVVFHTLRHTYASWLVKNGIDLYTTQKLMGHKDIKMTQRYAHLAPGHLEKAVNTLPSI